MKKIICLVFLAIITGCSTADKIGFIHLQSVFDGFVYKKELERELLSIKNNRKFVLDSLETDLKMLAKQIRTDRKNKELIVRFGTLRELYETKKETYEQEEEDMIRQFDDKILKQINSYVREYGVKNRYSVIYGANSTGNIMYGDTALDLTAKVTNYINTKHHGKN